MSEKSEEETTRNESEGENGSVFLSEESESDCSSEEIPRQRVRRSSTVVKTVGVVVLLLYTVLKKLNLCKACSETLP